MRLLFVASPKIGSQVIRWGLEEPVSHVAVDTMTALGIFHSYKSALVRASRKDFHKQYTVIDSVYLHFPDTKQEAAAHLFQSYVAPMYRYDYPALVYFAYRAALRKAFRVPYPKINRMQDIDSFLCTEVAYIAATVYAEIMGKLILSPDMDLAMITPWGLCNYLKARLA